MSTATAETEPSTGAGARRGDASSIRRRRNARREARRRAPTLPRSSHAGFQASQRPARSRRDHRGAGADAAARPGADPARADAGVALHLLSRCCRADGRRSCRHAAHRAPDTALRRCAPLELRGVRGSRPAADLRPQRLRRDAARPVRMGRQAAGGELRGRRTRPRRSTPARAARSTWPSARSYREAMIEFAEMRALDLWYARLDIEELATRWAAEVTRQAAQALRTQCRQGAHEGQPAGLRQAHPRRRRQAADHQRSAADRPDRGASAGSGSRAARERSSAP